MTVAMQQYVKTSLYLTKKQHEKSFNRYISHNNYRGLREWVYRDIKPRIIAEEMLEDETGHELQDYKFWCFNGTPRLMYVTNKGSQIYENFYDMEFKYWLQTMVSKDENQNINVQ